MASTGGLQPLNREPQHSLAALPCPLVHALLSCRRCFDAVRSGDDCGPSHQRCPLSLLGSCVASVSGEAAERATPLTPARRQTRGHRATTGEPSGSVRPPAAAQDVASDRAARPPGTPPEVERTPLERPASLRVGRRPGKTSPDTAPPPLQANGEHGASLPSDGPSLDSAVFSPSSLSDSDLLEAALDAPSGLGSEKPMPEKPSDITVNVQSTETPVHNKDTNATPTEGSHLSDATSGNVSLVEEPEKGCEEPRCVSPGSELVTEKWPEPGRVEGCDVPDTRKGEDLPSVSEESPPASLKPEPKKRQSLFKRNKKKSNPGNVSIHFNKAPVFTVSLCRGGKSLLVLFALHFAFYVLCACCFSKC